MTDAERIAELETLIEKMRHDLVTTEGLWACDKRDFAPDEAFQIVHPSLKPSPMTRGE